MKRLRNAMFKASGMKAGRQNVTAGYDHRGKAVYESIRNRSFYEVVVAITPAKLRTKNKCSGFGRSQRRKDRVIYIFLAKIKVAKRYAKKIAAMKKQRSNRIIAMLRG